ncbi:MAG: ComF family protein, partial [Burkholderiaceae bacterium]
HQRGRAQRLNEQVAWQVAEPQRVAGQSVLLIDDIMTTGATLDSAARCLRQAGAVRVDALVLARVPAP